MMTMDTPAGQPQAAPALDKSVPRLVALLMAIGLIGLIALAMLAGKKHLEF